eukprot:340226-Pyramimonas_sp.AAC.1
MPEDAVTSVASDVDLRGLALTAPMDLSRFPADKLCPIIESCNATGRGSDQAWSGTAPARAVLAQERKQ